MEYIVQLTQGDNMVELRVRGNKQLLELFSLIMEENHE